MSKRRIQRALTIPGIALLSLCLLSVSMQSCASSSKKTSLATRPAVETRVPALRWVPANAPYLVVGTGAELAIPWLEGAANILGELGLDVQGSAELGFDLGESSTLLANLGLEIDWQGSAAVFGDTSSLTAILPLVPNSESAGFTTKMIQQGAQETSHRSLEVLQGQSPIGQWATVILEGNLAFHLDLGVSQNSPSFAWIDSMLAASSDSSLAFGSGDDAMRVIETLASADPMYWGSALGLVRELQQGEWASCASLLSGIESLSFQANTKKTSVDITVTAQLSAALMESLHQVQSKGASHGMQILGAKAGVALDIGMDMAKTSQRLRSIGCSGLADPLAGLLRRSPWSPVPQSIHIAGSRLDPSELSGDIAAEISMASPDFIKSLLNQIPGRSWLESRKTLGGEQVKKLAIPTMSSVYYQLQDTLFRFTNQKSAMETLISQSATTTKELIALTIRPALIPQLESLLEMVLPPGFASFATTQLASLDHASLALGLEANTLTLHISIAGK